MLILALNEIEKIIYEVFSLTKTKNNNCIVILKGDLASGKTTFVKHFVKYLNLEDIVTSPTFSIQSIYSEKVFHYDIYNKSLEEFISLGLLEEFEKEGIHFVEWGDEKLEKLLKSYGFDVFVLEIKKDKDKRQYIINE
ncbi:tRNA (adenosine(37)-N6)-threonylcarbamoyltransferase complex ATPase subunit type 1 TsaE [Halarcobacter mediterraneus]|uniref:tRNA threonylcarbamoyladenosine biosynthesis protein TsaE n=1 Tax=Halarcobacter mediterraneus TaxID=2023153 RepID=A0A4Q1AX73_9BACT|nr:tRNA (adenosine(37)-N6)-threonylcarbamoyltransferase complex ATPase subunit type 1 TsaE [Halarcobacter mediterraneus]RXK14348.1 tRNA (adenosine(37)-N6)-threonylcarbamoyltransferase complex ATPase subunit type 1 TsaE [Halarcobacter mediterraneus]